MGALAPSALAAPASIAPSHLVAGTTKTITVTASACAAPEIQISGKAIGGSAELSSHGNHTFTGKVHVPASVSGPQTLSLRCGGGNYGSVTVTVGGGHHGGGVPGHGGSGSDKHPAPPGTLIARIGWHYTDETVFPIQHAEAVRVVWGACVKAGGTVLGFPKGKHLYPFDDPRSEKAGRLLATLSGPVLDPKDRFSVNMYVGDLAKPHSGEIPLECKRLKNHGVSGPLVTAFTGKLNIKYVRQDANFDPANKLGAMAEFGVEPGSTQNIVETNIACGEIGTETVSVTSDAIQDADGNHTVVFTRSAASEHSIKVAAYYADVTTADVATGQYPAIVSCGTGRVGVGKIRVG
jgi:hypothetical protein